MYLFDFDGTITGSDNFKNIIQFNVQTIVTPPYVNPSEFDIRWSILTSRPKMDELVVRFYCLYYKLTPETIDTSKDWRWKFKTSEDVAKFKFSVINSFLYEDYRINTIKRKIEKVVYIDNDHKLNSKINGLNTKNHSFIAIDMKEFLSENFYNYI